MSDTEYNTNQHKYIHYSTTAQQRYNTDRHGAAHCLPALKTSETSQPREYVFANINNGWVNRNQSY